MTKRSRQRLRQIVGRDTRIIKAYLGVIQTHEKGLLVGKRKNRIDETKLHAMTLTATRSSSNRSTVEHDMKAKFPRTSQNEFTECRKTAASLYESYLILRDKKGRKASRPLSTSCSRRIPRWTFAPQVFRLVKSKTTVARWWLNLRDSLDMSFKQQIQHDRLFIPLKVSPFHENQFNRGQVKAAQIFTDRHGKWWVTLAVRLEELSEEDDSLPPAVLGIDLGIEKAACASLVTTEKVRTTVYFKQEDKIRLLKKYDNQVAALNHEMHTRKNNGLRYDSLARKLKSIRTRRENLSREYDRVLVRQILNHRKVAKRGNRRGRGFRRLIHSWAFARITESLKHQLAQLGWSVEGKNARFRAVPESWTSIICWKCGNKGRRPKQNYFQCTTCGHKTNADRNGAINIAARLITLTDSLHSVRGQGKWASAVARRKLPKTRRTKSQGKSLLSKKGRASSPRESAVVHQAQTKLLSFSDGTEVGDDDQTVENTVDTLAAAGNDKPASRQEKEARSVGGIPSQ
jgi:transposase